MHRYTELRSLQDRHRTATERHRLPPRTGMLRRLVAALRRTPAPAPATAPAPAPRPALSLVDRADPEARCC